MVRPFRGTACTIAAHFVLRTWVEVPCFGAAAYQTADKPFQGEAVSLFMEFSEDVLCLLDLCTPVMRARWMLAQVRDVLVCCLTCIVVYKSYACWYMLQIVPDRWPFGG
jgi:hypothetical protein